MATRRITPALRLAAVLAAAATAITVVPSVVLADPKPSIEEVQRTVDALYEEAEEATERAHDARVQVEQATDRLAQIRARLARQERQVAELDAAIAGFAAAMYAGGGVDPTLQAMLADDPTEFLARAASLDQVARVQDTAFRQAEVARLESANTRIQLDQELAALKELEARLVEEKKSADAKLAEARELLSTLKAAERRRLERIEAARAAAAAAASRDALRSTPTPSAATSAGPVSGRAGAAVAYARAQVGKAYVFGASGPSAFDCSGLTSSAWAQAGVYLPHAASQQYAATARVDRSALQPGDLVFFYSTLHHVGIYIGGNVFVHAANPGKGVVAESLFGGYYETVYMGAGRV